MKKEQFRELVKEIIKEVMTETNEDVEVNPDDIDSTPDRPSSPAMKKASNLIAKKAHKLGVHEPLRPGANKTPFYSGPSKLDADKPLKPSELK